MLAGGFLAPARASEARIDLVPGRARSLLAAVERWGCQYQKIDVDAIAASDLDLIVLDPSLNDDALIFLSGHEIEKMKLKPNGGRRLVLAYLSIGEANVNRWFWPDAWRRSPPDWLGPADLDWPGAHHVRFWDPQWQALIFAGEDSLLNGIVAAGFDGVLLDRVDGYLEWMKRYPAAEKEMVDLVQRISRWAREARPDFLLMAQNAEDLLYYDAYRSAIDGLNKESLFTGLHGANTRNSANDVAWSVDRLTLAAKAGIQVFVTDYATSEIMRSYARRAAHEIGLPLFQGTRHLDRLPE